MVKSQAEDDSLAPTRACCHTLRKTGIATYLQNDAKPEVAQHIAGHVDASTTKLHDRRRELVYKEEAKKIEIWRQSTQVSSGGPVGRDLP